MFENLGPIKDEVSFSDHFSNYCVCFVDMIDSTKIVALINNSQKIANYYSVFLNSISKIIKRFGGKIIKNSGDGILCYFPETSDYANRSAFRNVIECAITMTAAFIFINSKMHDIGLPDVSYRVSADYGKSAIARSTTSQNYDLFGPTMDICAKINSKATPNGTVIGGDLYRMLKSLSLSSSAPSPDPNFLDDYYFKVVGEYPVTGLKQSYPIYSVTSKYPNEDYFTLIEENNKSITQQQHLLREEEGTYEQKTQVQGIFTQNILLVEDEPDLVFTYKSMLNEEGYNVDAFTDPQQALRHFAQLAPSFYMLILLDIRMPNLNGIQLYYRIKAIDQNIKIIFVTALDAVNELSTVLPGFSSEEDIIKKPITRADYINKVKEALCC